MENTTKMDRPNTTMEKEEVVITKDDVLKSLINIATIDEMKQMFQTGLDTPVAKSMIIDTVRAISNIVTFEDLFDGYLTIMNDTSDATFVNNTIIFHRGITNIEIFLGKYMSRAEKIRDEFELYNPQLILWTENYLRSLNAYFGIATLVSLIIVHGGDSSAWIRDLMSGALHLIRNESISKE